MVSESKTALIVMGAILLILGGAASVALFSLDNGFVINGVPYQGLNQTGFEILLLTSGVALTGFVLLIIAVAVNRTEPTHQPIVRPVAQQSFVCKGCGTQVRLNQKHCDNCGRVLEWDKCNTDAKYDLL